MDSSSMIGSPIVITDSERDMPGIEPGPLGWHTSPRDTRSKAIMVRVPPTMALL